MRRAVPPPSKREARRQSRLSLHASRIRDALYQVFLTVEEEEQARDHVDRRHREGEADLPLVDLGEEDAQRLGIRVLEAL